MKIELSNLLEAGILQALEQVEDGDVIEVEDLSKKDYEQLQQKSKLKPYILGGGVDNGSWYIHFKKGFKKECENA